MGSLVSAFAMSHVLGAPNGQETQAENVFQGMKYIGRQLRNSRPDLIIVISSDHLNNFSLSQPMPLAIGTAESYIPYGDMGIPRDAISGSAEFAQGFAAFAEQHEMNLASVNDVQPDHGIMIPLAMVDPERTLPMVPLYINTVFTPAPSPAESWRLGELLKQYIEQSRPSDERVAIIACGGLSHWLGVPEEGRVNEIWDRGFMAQLLSNNKHELRNLTNAEILEQAGNGGLEVNTWITLAAMVPQCQGEVIFYEAIPAWASGMAGVELLPSP